MNLMKVLKVMLTIMTLGAVSTFSLSCGSEAGEPELSENQIATVQRGNLTIDITAVGNLALSRTEDLAFEIAGTVEEVLTEEGDSVEEGQVLARLDTSEWEDYLEALKEKLTAAERTLATKERAVTAAERTLATKERAVTTAERTLATKERAVATKELALRSAQISLQTAEYNLNQIAEVKKAQDTVDNAEYDLKIAQAMWEKAIKSEASASEVSYWFGQLTFYKARLAEAEQEKREILAESSVRVTTEVALEIESKKLAVEQAQQGVVDAQIAIEDAQIAVEDAQIALDDAGANVEDAQIALDDARTDVEDAQKEVEDARETLDEALNTSPEIIAPFDGFVTKVNVEGGDEVLKGTVAVVIADPAKFEADILVSEMDILQVKVGGEAWMQVDAMPGLRLPARVTHISPTASIQQGVVNYKVKVELQPMEATMPERQQERQGTTAGEMPERLRQAIEEGRVTQEQIEEMMKQRQEGQGAQQRQLPTMLPENFQLRQGLTVTVSIIVNERSNVLLVPNSAIATQSRQTFVQVLAADGTLEPRAIQTGISNWQYTEVTEGISEGEQVVIPRGSTATTPATQQRPPGGMFIPGMGRMR